MRSQASVQGRVQVLRHCTCTSLDHLANTFIISHCDLSKITTFLKDPALTLAQLLAEFPTPYAFYRFSCPIVPQLEASPSSVCTSFPADSSSPLPARRWPCCLSSNHMSHCQSW